MSAMRSDIVRVARSYLGTPFQHRQRLPGVGLDCAGVLVCAARELGLVAPDWDVPDYRRAPDGTLLDWCRRYMREIPFAEARAGDALALVVDEEPQHLGILADWRGGAGRSLIHAAMRKNGRGSVAPNTSRVSITLPGME